MTHNKYDGGNLYHQMQRGGDEAAPRTAREKVISIGLTGALIAVVVAVVYVLNTPVS